MKPMIDAFSMLLRLGYRRVGRQHARFHLHFIPTSASWLNLVERWFGLSASRRFAVAALPAWRT